MGSWKTEFLKRLAKMLHDNEHPVICIDAWEIDFIDDPLTVISHEFFKQLEFYVDEDEASIQRFQSKKQEFIKSITTLVPAGVKGAVLLSSGSEAIADIAGGVARHIIKNVSDKNKENDSDIKTQKDNAINKLSSPYVEKVEAFKNIKKLLHESVQSLNTDKVTIVIIDELDRCRPNYSIRILEVIKHFFNTKDIVFVVATNRDALCNSIKAVYGSEFDSLAYLKRFFDRTAYLPEASIEEYMNEKYQSFRDSINASADEESIVFCDYYPESSKPFDFFIERIIDLKEKDNIELRDIDQLVASLESCIPQILDRYRKNKTKQLIYLNVLIMGWIETSNNPKKFLERENFKNSDDGDDSTFRNVTLVEYKNIDIVSRYRLSTFDVGRKIKHEAHIEPSTYPNAVNVKNNNRPVVAVYWEKFIPLEYGKRSNFIKKMDDYETNKEYYYWHIEDYKKIITLSGAIS